MSEALRLLSLSLFAIGPVVAVLALLRRRLKPSQTQSRIRGWRWYVPTVLLPVEWLLPPVLIALRVGEIEVGWLPVRVVGLAVGLAGTLLLVWAFLLLGSGVASMNVCLLLLWPVSLLGIVIQAVSEEQILGQKFGKDYERYVQRTGLLFPRFRGQAAEQTLQPTAAAGLVSWNPRSRSAADAVERSRW